MIPKNILKHHILAAIREIDSQGVPRSRKSSGYALIIGGKRYPPKYVVSIANRYANGQELNHSTFSGGKETNDYLRKNGFEILDLAEGATKKAPIEEPVPASKSHYENCQNCKESIRRFLEKAYVRVEKNYAFNLGPDPDAFQDSPYYASIKEILKALQGYRGYGQFVKSKTLPNCDLFVPDPGIIVEIDESQHFTEPRAISLEKYPHSLKLGYDRQAWIKACRKLNRRDNSPPYRDEQRAWYDTLRDFYANLMGMSIVRISPMDQVWCSLDDENRDHVRWFNRYLEKKLSFEARAEKGGAGKPPFRIGLAFPERGQHDLAHFFALLEGTSHKFDLLVFPEGFETIKKSDAIGSDELGKDALFLDIVNKYQEISKVHETSIITGVAVDHKDDSISGRKNDQYCMLVSPQGMRGLYHKHSSSKFVAFFDDKWSLETSFPVVAVGSKKVGMSICHDSYISLIPRILKTKGADIWVNISFKNVRAHIWEAVLQTRAAENGNLAVCTLHRQSSCGRGGGRPQKEPYAFSEKGKIRLRDIKTEEYLDEIPEGERSGRIFYFDADEFSTSPIREAKERDMPMASDAISITKNSEGKLALDDSTDGFILETIPLKEFAFMPEVIWQRALKRRDKVTIFVVLVKDGEEWNTYRPIVERIIRGRVIEFSTLFIFVQKEKRSILMAAYRSSNYKDSRVLFDKEFPLRIDRRFLKGMESTFEISLGDDRAKSDKLYFDKVDQMLRFLLQNSVQVD